MNESQSNHREGDVPQIKTQALQRSTPRGWCCGNTRALSAWDALTWTLASFLVLHALPVFAGDTSAILAVGQRECLSSILVHRDGIFASTPNGLYLASQVDKKWAKLLTDSRMPMEGTFVAEHAGLRPIGPRSDPSPAFGPAYYFTPYRACQSSAAEHANVYGLYRLESDKRKWVLLSAEYQFKQVYVHGGILYAIVVATEQVEGQTGYFNRVVRSKDSGSHWEDISHGIEHGVGLGLICGDPDNQGLVCLITSGYVLQAIDDNYQWRRISPSHWRTAQISEWFFLPNYETSGTLYMHTATLANYFDYPFGDSAQIPSFHVTTGHAYSFKPGQRIVVPVEIGFWDENGDTVKLIDVEGGRSFWGLRRTLPGGKREYVQAKRDVARDSPRVAAHLLTHGQSYERSLDLSTIADFSATGAYHVQLIYENWQAADAAKGDWRGSFSSPVFDVKVLP